MKPKTSKNGYAKEPIVTNNLYKKVKTKNDWTIEGQVNQQLKLTAQLGQTQSNNQLNN